MIGAQVLMVFTERRDYPVGDFLWNLLPLNCIHGNRILACEAKNQQRPSSSWIPQSKLPPFGRRPLEQGITNNI